MRNALRNLSLAAAILSISLPIGAMTTQGTIPDAAAVASASDDPCSYLAAQRSARGLTGLMNDPDPRVQDCAIRAAGRAKDAASADILLGNVESYLHASGSRSYGAYENNLRARLKAINSIWALGEMRSSRIMARLLRFFEASDQTIKINLVIGAGKARSPLTAAFLYKLAGSAEESNEVRAAAYEMLAEDGVRAPAPRLSFDGMQKADIIYTGGLTGIPQDWIGDLAIGHAGIYGGTEIRNGRLEVLIYDCVPDNFKPYGGVRKIYSFRDFTHEDSYPFFGNRVSKTRPTPEQRELVIKAAIAKLGHHYSNSHFQQKGPDYFDCVGFTEYAYEAAGLNPTPDDQETGWGWPLTPAEQFAATVPDTQNAPAPVNMPPLPLPQPQNTGIVAQSENAVMHAFGLRAQSLPGVPLPTGVKAVN